MSNVKTIDEVQEMKLTPTQGVMCVMGADGDTKIIWDRTKPDEVDNARQSFKSLRGKGYAAYSVRGDRGEKGEVVTEFDPNSERLILAKPMVGG